jgi:peroxiredoxin
MASISPGQVVASFRLPSSSGDSVSLWQYKQRQPLVLVLWEDGGPQLLAGFVRCYQAYRRLGAEVLAIGRTAPACELPFPALLDADGSIADRLAEQYPAILVLDSFGELFTRLQGARARQPDHDDLLDWVWFTEVQCEECGPHAENWPRRPADD